MLTADATFWAKARPLDNSLVSIHPIAAHALDVAAVATLLPRRFSLDTRALGFLVALHDIGKFSRPFQAQAERHWPTAMLGPFPDPRPPSGPRHDALGLFLLRQTLADQFEDLLPLAGGRWMHAERIWLWRALAGHHGGPAPEGIPSPGANVLCGGCIDAATAFVRDMHTLFRPPLLPGPENDRDTVLLSWHLAGLTTLADWVGSRQEWFPYVSPEAVDDPGGYFWNHAIPRAMTALAQAGLAPARPAPFAGLRGLFPVITAPSEVQQWAETVALPSGPLLAVIEDATGSGKTEAALTLAHRLLAAGRGNGLYFALPTMATANAMFGRLGDCYRGLFSGPVPPSLALAHGRAALDPRFAAILSPPIGSTPLRVKDAADEPAEAQCAAWLAQDRRRALLAQVGVGTLDQALLAVLPVRHAPLRLHGVSGKVVIVDEVHAYDVYMREELTTFLRFHAALGGSAILLSATLPKSVRSKLLNTFRDGLNLRSVKPSCDAYPLATTVSAAGLLETPCALRAELARGVAVTRLADVPSAIARIVTAAQSGAAVAWVRNTVDDAIAAASNLRAAGVEPLLFHARFAMADRLEIEGEVLRRFGRTSDPTTRPGVLVATQVIEQSLDLDFDLLVTDLAPADLLIQRAGRLWRHQRQERPIPGPELLVLSPKPVADPPPEWLSGAFRGTAAVYGDPALLWRSARALFDRGVLVTPDDMRDLTETAFDRNQPGAVPPRLEKADSKVLGKTRGQEQSARQNLLDPDQGYNRNAGLWEPEERTPTRLEDQPQVTLRLALLRDGDIVPYAGDTDIRRAWALSEIVVARRRVAACPIPAGLEAAIERAKQTWSAWERDSDRVIPALMTVKDETYTLEVRTEAGASLTIGYDVRIGLIWPNPEASA